MTCKCQHVLITNNINKTVQGQCPPQSFDWCGLIDEILYIQSIRIYKQTDILTWIWKAFIPIYQSACLKIMALEMFRTWCHSKIFDMVNIHAHMLNNAFITYWYAAVANCKSSNRTTHWFWQYWQKISWSFSMLSATEYTFHFLYAQSND